MATRMFSNFLALNSASRAAGDRLSNSGRDYDAVDVDTVNFKLVDDLFEFLGRPLESDKI